MNLLICDDHKIVRDGLRQILQQVPEISTIEEAGNDSELIQLFKRNIFDVVLLDISLPNVSGLELLQTIKLKWEKTNVLMLSMRPQAQYAMRAHKLGASGYLTKDTSSEELLNAIKIVSKGRKYISESLADSMFDSLNYDKVKQPHELLSDREFEIFIQLANGVGLPVIGSKLAISSKTVSTYRARILEKMGLNNNSNITKYCLENNLI